MTRSARHLAEYTSRVLHATLALAVLAGCGRVGFEQVQDATSPSDGQLGFDLCDRAAPGVPALAGRIWYVAPTGSDTTGDGSPGAPYASLDGLATLPQPGDHVVMLPGTYGQQRVLFDGAIGTPVVITTEQDQSVVIDGVGVTQQYDGALVVSNRHDLVVDGLQIRNSGERGVSADFAMRLTLQNLRIEHSAHQAIVVGGPDHVIDHNVIVDSGARFAGGDGTSTSAAITVNWNTSGLDNSGYTIRRNRIVGVWGYGITAMHLKSVSIVDNHVAETATAAFALNRISDAKIERNVIARETSGYRFGSVTTAGLQIPIGASANPAIEAPFTTPTQNILVANNIMRGVTWAVGTFCIEPPLLADTNDATWIGITIAHNSFVDTLEPISVTSSCPSGPAPTGFVAVNNVALRSPGAVAGPWLTPSYNCWDTSAGTLGSATDVAGACGLVDSTSATYGSYMPTPSASVLGAGSPVGAVTTDILCRPRSPSAPSLGAYESAAPP